MRFLSTLRFALLCTVTGFSTIAAANLPTVAAEAPAGFSRGSRMPFHVVDFLGEGPRSGGCPSVMISNTRQCGVEIWSRTLDGQTLQLAAALQKLLPATAKKRGFVLLFDSPAAASVTKKAKKAGVTEFYFCKPRSSGSKLINYVDKQQEHATIVFLEDRKLNKAVWKFKPGALNKQAIEAVVKEVRAITAAKEAAGSK